MKLLDEILSSSLFEMLISKYLKNWIQLKKSQLSFQLLVDPLPAALYKEDGHTLSNLQGSFYRMDRLKYAFRRCYER